MRRGGGARRSQPRSPDNGPYLNRPHVGGSAVQLCRMGPQMTGRVFMGGIDARPDRGVHTRLVTRRVHAMALVFVGGAAGTAARAAAGLLMTPTLGEVPGTLAVTGLGAVLV